MCISGDETVVTWAKETFERYKREAEPASLDGLPN
jgi:predicted transcriptional regulator